MRILAIHGVATGEDDPVATLWQKELRAHGVRCEVSDGRWPSTGSFVTDAARFADPQFRNDAIESVAHAVDDFALGGSGILLAHSMGTVLLLHAERILRTKFPILCLASPLSNPLIWPTLHAIGFGRPPALPVIHIWNDDDPIPGGNNAHQPDYFLATRIAVADNEAKQYLTEHDARAYLRHPHTHRALGLLSERIS